MTAGDLNGRVAFDLPTGAVDEFGNPYQQWTRVHACWAEFRYSGGGEAAQAARLEGRTIFKVKIRSCIAARALTAEHRMLDLRRVTYDGGVPQSGVYNIRQIDTISDRAWVYITAEAGVAV